MKRDGPDARKRLARLIDRAERPGPLSLSPEEVDELSTLLRETSYELAEVRSRGHAAATERRLNDLVIRAHHTFYRTTSTPPAGLARFFAVAFPRRVRESRAFVLAATVAFALPLIVSWGVVGSDTSVAHRILPGAVLHSMKEMYEPSPAGEETPTRADAAMAGFYVRNNVSIAFQCVALGAFAGVGTLYVLLSNGIQLGTIAGFVTGEGHGWPFVDFVVSHSALELTAIVIAGAAGLVLGHGLLSAGGPSKVEAIAARAKVAAELSGGAAALLLGAALIEGFWSAEPYPFVIKCALGASLWVAVAAYLLLAGRESAA